MTQPLIEAILEFQRKLAEQDVYAWEMKVDDRFFWRVLAECDMHQFTAYKLPGQKEPLKRLTINDMEIVALRRPI